MNKKHVAVLMGGWSSEREVSLSSGQGVVQALMDLGYDVKPIDVKEDLPLLIQQLTQPQRPDVVFNALHGVGGEDGVIQGVLEMLRIPYTHSGVTASALAMNKILSRQLFECHSIPVPVWQVIPLAQLKKHHPMDFPYVIKPISEGSSRGVSLIFSQKDYEQALHEWNFGNHVLIEQYIPGREIHIAVVDDKAVGAIEIKPLSGFYDYRAKYTPGHADHLMPAPLTPEEHQKVLEMAEKAHKLLGCRGISRADFRYDDISSCPTFYLLEVNTQPGMTPLSLVPEITSYYGLSYNQLVEKLVESASCHALTIP